MQKTRYVFSKRDFNTEISDLCVGSFVYELALHDVVKKKTYFKSVHNPSCIDRPCINK